MVELSGLEALAGIVEPVAQRFVADGHRIYLVGGVVRDLVLAGDDPLDLGDNDIDLTTDALPADIKRLVGPLAEALWAQGERFGTIGVTIAGQPMEITTHRAEDYDADSRKPVVSFGRELHEDLSRRDFTVNAMAIELPTRTLHDPYHGEHDLAAGVLRTPLAPEVSFGDDPLRIMRAARFVSRFGLTPDPELVAAAERLSARLEIVSVERVADELERLLAVSDPSAGLRFLADTGALGHILPGYDPVDSGPVAVAMALAGAPGDVAVRRAGLLWPLGDRAGEALSRLRYSNADRARTVRLIAGGAEALRPDIGPAEVRRIVASVGIDDLALVQSLAANLAEHDPRAPSGALDRLDAVVSELRRSEDLGDLKAPLSGSEIVRTLGLEPGPEIGRAQRFLIEHRLDNGPFGADEARELLLRWRRIEHDRN